VSFSGPVIAVSNVTAHPSTASVVVPTTTLLGNGSSLQAFMWPVGMTISDVLRVFFLSLLSDGSLAHINISIVTLRYRYTDICMD